jgi:hypothetical protein
MTATRPPWKSLSHTLRLRRNLQCALSPVVPTNWNIPEWRNPTVRDFAEKARQFKAEQKQHRARTFAECGVRTQAQARRKLAELQAEEARLWSLCRPDLHPPV